MKGGIVLEVTTTTTMDHHPAAAGAQLSSSESFSCSDPSKLTDSELDCLKEAFSLFDADHDGEITVHELGRVMRNHGLNPTDDELKDMIRNVDKNSNGAIDFNEFIEMMLRRDSKAVRTIILDLVNHFAFFTLHILFPANSFQGSFLCTWHGAHASTM